MSKINIFISCHKPSKFVSDNIFKPIQLGCDLSSERFEGMYYDNVGDNISQKNKMYCELTAQYWAWKNVDLDYYGFFHYRRYLNFNERSSIPKDVWGNQIIDSLDEKNIMECGWSKENIQNIIGKYDIILPEKKDILMMPNMGKSMEEQYFKNGNLHKEDIEIMENVIENKYPSFSKYVKQYAEGHTTYFNNMFIMKKNIFDEFCRWEFDILDECVKLGNYEDYSVEALRTP